MSKLISKNNRIWVFVLLGLILGVLLTAVGGVIVYESITGKDIKSKIFYLIDTGAVHLSQKSRKVVENINDQEKRGPDQESDFIEINIKVDRPVRKINPLIYGSNLSAKTEFEMDVAKFGKDIGITNFRYPGGDSFGYRWSLGLYDFADRFDRAPLSKIENIIKFCKLVNAQLIVQVNVESGTPLEAAQWVEYMNKEGGFRVDYWELGNEVYGDWDRAYMSGEDYVKVIKEYSTLMKRVDPTIKIGANWGGSKYHEFDKAIVKEAADFIDFISYHWYPNHINRDHRYKERTHPLPKEVMANALAVGKLVDRFEEMVEAHAPHRRGKIEFTIMEWDGSWDATSSDLNYEYRGMMWSLSNAIFYADALGQFARHGITVANHYDFQEVMFGLIRGWDVQAGWGGSRWDGETVRPKALALKLFARHFGDILVESQLSGSPTYQKEADWRPDSYVGDVPYIASYASQSSKDGSISIVLINKHADKNFTSNISIEGVSVGEEGETWILTGPDLKAQNDGSPGKVAIKKYDLSGVKSKFSYEIPARSVSLLKIPSID